MRGLLCLVLCCMIGGQDTLAQLSAEPIDLGIIVSSGKLGNLSINMEITHKEKEVSAHARFMLEQLIENAQRIIPVLEPFKVVKPFSSVIRYYPKYQAPYEQKAVIEYDNITVLGLQLFRLEKLEVRLKTRRLDFELYFPRLSVDVLYKTNLQLADQLTGKVNVNLTAVSLRVAYQFAPTGDGHMKIVGMEYYNLARFVQYNLQDRPQVRFKRYLSASDRTYETARIIAQATANAIAETTVKELNTHVLPNYTEAQILKLLLPDEE